MITSRDLGQYRYAIATGTRLYILFTMSNATGNRREADAETAAIFNAKDVGRIGPRAPQATFYFANHFILLLYLILQNCVF